MGPVAKINPKPGLSATISRKENGDTKFTQARNRGDQPFKSSVVQSLSGGMVDAFDLKSNFRKEVRVRVPPRAPTSNT